MQQIHTSQAYVHQSHVHTYILTIICKQRTYYKQFLIPRIHHTDMSSTQNTPQTKHTHMLSMEIRQKKGALTSASFHNYFSLNFTNRAS